MVIKSLILILSILTAAKIAAQTSYIKFDSVTANNQVVINLSSISKHSANRDTIKVKYSNTYHQTAFAPLITTAYYDTNDFTNLQEGIAVTAANQTGYFNIILRMASKKYINHFCYLKFQFFNSNITETYTIKIVGLVE